MGLNTLEAFWFPGVVNEREKMCQTDIKQYADTAGLELSLLHTDGTLYQFLALKIQFLFNNR